MFYAGRAVVSAGLFRFRLVVVEADDFKTKRAGKPTLLRPEVVPPLQTGARIAWVCAKGKGLDPDADRFVPPANPVLQGLRYGRQAKSHAKLGVDARALRVLFSIPGFKRHENRTRIANVDLKTADAALCASPDEQRVVRDQRKRDIKHAMLGHKELVEMRDRRRIRAPVQMVFNRA